MFETLLLAEKSQLARADISLQAPAAASRNYPLYISLNIKKGPELFIVDEEN